MTPTVAACGRTHKEARARAERRALALGLKEYEIRTYLFTRDKPPVIHTLPADDLRRVAARKRKEQGK